MCSLVLEGSGWGGVGSNALGSRPFPSVCYGVGRGDPGMEPGRRSSGTRRLTDGGAGAGTAREASWATSWGVFF